ncbi:MAG: hypothetical protein IKY41_07125 [Clostridia bacterium]|nr:hypothetical protein [Clostridia bacterium]
MGQEQFNAMLSVISADIAKMIVQKKNISEKEAIKLLYTSKVYAALEQEDTKLWQYSTPMLYSLLEQEWESGTIRYPDV